MKFDGGWCYANSLLAAANEIFRKLSDIDELDITEICHRYGIFLEHMTEAEKSEFERLVDSL